MTTTRKFDPALVRPGRCAVCGRKVSTASMDSMRAVAFLVDETGAVVTEGPAEWAWVGPECRKTL